MTTSTDITVIPTTGEVINLNDPAACATALEEIRDLERLLREAKNTLSDAVAAYAARIGTKTLHLNNLEVEVTGGVKIEWLTDVLEELRDLGLPEDRYSELVVPTVTYKVNAAVARQVAGANPTYAAVIERARQTINVPWRVSVRR